VRSVASARLRAIKLAHTAVWAGFAGYIVAIPALAVQNCFGVAAALTAVAAQYTDDRRANFDIYLPEWLARYNKHVFGPLFVAGVAFAAVRYLGAP